MTATLRSPFNLSAHLRPTVGDQKMTYAGVDHMGWMLCDGRSLSPTDYGLLFGVINYTFGRDGDLFKLPDFRGCVPGMAGRPSFSNGPTDVNPTSNALGTYLGEQQHRLTVSEMPTHNHGVAGGSDPTLYNQTSLAGEHDHGGSTGNNSINVVTGGGSNINDTTDLILDQEDNYVNSLTSNTPHTHPISNQPAHFHLLSNQGDSNYHNNMQPTLFAGNMFIYSGRNIDGYFPYTWVGGTPASNATPGTPGNVLIF